MELPTHILAHLRLPAALCLGSGGAAWAFPCPPRPFCWPPARSRPRAKSAFRWRCWPAWRLAHRRQHLVPHRPPLRTPRTAPAVQAVDGADHLRPPHPGLLRPPPQVTLMIAKFVPGLATLAPPVAGQNGMSFGEFLFFDGIGATLWVGRSAARRGPAVWRCAQARSQPAQLGGRFSGALLVLGILGFLWPASCAAAWCSRKLVPRASSLKN
jgi:hypothetical protein